MTRPRPIRKGPKGFYTLVPILRTVLVVTNRLPRVPSTLWLRLLGRNHVLTDAIIDLKLMPAMQYGQRMVKIESVGIGRSLQRAKETGTQDSRRNAL